MILSSTANALQEGDFVKVKTGTRNVNGRRVAVYGWCVVAYVEHWFDRGAGRSMVTAYLGQVPVPHTFYALDTLKIREELND